MEKLRTLDSSEKTIAILGNRWWPLTAKQEGDEDKLKVSMEYMVKRIKRPNVGGVSV